MKKRRFSESTTTSAASSIASPPPPPFSPSVSLITSSPSFSSSFFPYSFVDSSFLPFSIFPVSSPPSSSSFSPFSLPLNSVRSLISSLLPTTTAGQSNYNVKLQNKYIMIDKNTNNQLIDNETVRSRGESERVMDKIVGKIDDKNEITSKSKVEGRIGVKFVSNSDSVISIGNLIEKAKQKHGKKVKKRVKSLSLREKRQLGLNSSIQSTTSPALRFSFILELNKLWNQYINQVLNLDENNNNTNDNNNNNNNNNSSSVSQLSELRFLKSDWHGAFILILRSRCPSFVNLSGIVLQETTEMFRILTAKNEIKSVTKRGSVFQIRTGEIKENGEGDWQRTFEIYGDQITIRSSERTVKKFKNKPNIQL